MLWILVVFVAMGLAFSYMGWRWESTRRRPPLGKEQMVSVIIASYNSPLLKDSVDSAKALDYSNKEIIVVNDSPEEVSFPGVRVINNMKRTGKSHAMNQAVSHAKGEILFFLDSDTIVEKDALTKLVPWFSKGVAAVSPKFVVRNKKNFLTRLISMEHTFMSSLFKIHMYFGSLISFRGCGIAIRKDVLNKLGGWRETMIEDTDMGALMVKNGYKILYEPDAVVRTEEPDTWKEYKRQRMRWGIGSGLSFINHYRTYLKNPQFGLYIFPYMLIGLAMAGVFLYQTTIYMLPIASLYLLYTLSIKEVIGMFILFAFPLMSSMATSATVAGITHFAIVTNSERKEAKDLLMIIPYMFVFFPFTMAIYTKGIIQSVFDKKRGRKEVDLKLW